MRCLFFLVIYSFTLLGVTFDNNLYQKNINISVNDSILNRRFTLSLLSEHEKPGRWIFTKVKRCDNKEEYEIIESRSIYKAFSEKTSGLTETQYLQIASETIFVQQSIYSCLDQIKLYFPKATYELEEKKVNMDRYGQLIKIPIKKLLSTFFDSNQNYKKKYCAYLNEIIAVCYTNNIKVITDEGGCTKYQIFK